MSSTTEPSRFPSCKAQLYPSPLQVRTLTFLRAASFGRRDVLLKLLSQGVSPNKADYDNRTALMMACAAGHVVSLRHWNRHKE